MDPTKPTRKMTNYCEKVSRKSGIPLPVDYDVSFEVARHYLDKYSSYIIGYDQSIAYRGEQYGQVFGHNGQDNQDETVDKNALSNRAMIQPLKKIALLFFSGCLLLLVSTGATSLLDLEQVSVVSVILGLFSLFGLMLVFLAAASLTLSIPMIALLVTSLLFIRLRIWLCILIVVGCLLKPWNLPKNDPAY